MKNNSNNVHTRRKFLQQAALAGTGLEISAPSVLLAKNLDNKRETITNMSKPIKTRGYAGTSETSPLTPWEFERRTIGDNDILIEVKYSGICHSDIHTIKGHWGKQPYPQVPGHEIAGIVTAVGKNVTKFQVGDKAGVGCMVDSCMECTSCKTGEEHHCDNGATVYTYGSPDKKSPSGITQGGYSNNLVVTEHFAIKIPKNIPLEFAAPLLCAGITTYSPLMNARFHRGDKVGVAGIGGLGHIAIKLAVAKGAEVYAFTTSEEKKADIIAFGAKEVIVVDNIEKLKPYYGKLDYMISTIPYKFDVSSYIMVVKPYGHFTQVGQPINGEFIINNGNFFMSRVNYNSSVIGGIPETQEVMDFCALNKIYPTIKIIKASEINDAWAKVINKQARYRFVIDAATL